MFHHHHCNVRHHGKTYGCSTSGRAFSGESTPTKIVSKKTHLRIQAQSVDNIREKAKKDSREGVPKHEFNFNAKYVPFASSDKSETYSLDEVIYRSKNGGLLDVEHDMEALGKYPPGTFVSDIVGRFLSLCAMMMMMMMMIRTMMALIFLVSIIIANNGVSFFLSSRMLETTSKDAQKLTICPFLSRLSRARHRILENVVRRTRRQNVVAVRLRRLVQERVGPTGHRRRRYRFHVRRQLELILGGKVRTRVPRNERFVGQTVR